MARLIIFSVIISLCTLYADKRELLAEKGKELLEKGSYEIAIETLEKFVDAEESILGVESLIEGYRLTGEYEKALKLAQKYSKNKNAEHAARGSLFIGELLQITGKYKEAHDHLMTAHISNEKDLRIRVSLGSLLLKTGKRDKAVSIFSDIFDNYYPDEEYSSEELVAIGTACRYYAMYSDEVDRSDTLSNVINVILSDVENDNGAIELEPSNFPAYIQTAQMFLEAFNTVDAGSTLRQALKMNPHHPELLYNQAIYFSQNYAKKPEVMPTLNHALQINPKYADAFVLAASVHLADGENKRAYDKLQQALKVNPNHLDALTWLAAYHYVREENGAYEEIKNKVLAINSEYGEFYYLLGVILSQKFQYGAALKMCNKAIELNPFLWGAYIELGNNLMRTGEEDEARKYFEKVREEYNFHVQTHNMLMLLDKFGEFKMFETENFRFRLHTSEADIMFPLISEHMEKSIKDMAKIYGFTPETPMLLEVYPETKDFSVRVIGLSMIAASGVCFGKVLAQISPKGMPLGTMNWASVGWHELSHAFTLQMTDHKIPRWFTEGLSEMFERDRNPSVIRKRDKDLLQVYQTGLMRGIEDLNAGFTRPKYAIEVVVCYYQAGLICHFIRNNYGFQAIKDMLQMYKEGKDDAEIIEEVTGKTPKEFDGYFEKWLQKNIFGKMTVLEFVSSNNIEDLKDQAIEDPENINTYKKLAIAYLQSNKLRDAETNAGYLIALEPEDATAYDVLGRIFYRRKNFKKSQTFFKQAIELGCNNFNTYLYMGIMAFNNKDTKSAEKFLKKAKESFPNYVGPSNPYLLLAKLYKATGQMPKYYNEIEQYLGKEGNKYKLRIEIADYYFQQKKFKTASKWLEEALDIFPFEFDFQMKRALVFTKLKKWTQAITAYELALALKPKKDKHVIHGNIADLYLKINNKEKAKVHAESALEIEPGYHKAEEILEKLK